MSWVPPVVASILIGACVAFTILIIAATVAYRHGQQAEKEYQAFWEQRRKELDK